MTATSSKTLTGVKRRRLLVLNGEKVLSDTVESEAFLRGYPKGAYTTMRTMMRDGKVGIFMYERHVKRLADSCLVMMQEQKRMQREDHEKGETSEVNEVEWERFDRDVKSVLCDSSRLKKAMTPCIQMSMTRYLEWYHDKQLASLTLEANDDVDNNGEWQRNVNAHELKISHLITWDLEQNQYAFYTHVCDLPMRPTNPVLCDIRRGSRADIKGKDSSWVAERKKLWQVTTNDANEIVMCEDDGSIREGVSSNFFVVYDNGTIVTASDKIVQGTVMQLLFDVCKEMGVKVEHRPAGPNLQELPKWREAFITSTSRLILPIDTFVIGADCMKDFTHLRQNDKFMSLLTTDESLHPGEFKYALNSTDLTLKLFEALHRRMQDMTTILEI